MERRSRGAGERTRVYCGVCSLWRGWIVVPQHLHCKMLPIAEVVHRLHLWS